ncbi:hypothetical protein [Listeria booriae]|uniref:Uncharacterized protein n=1 Tax=Listeria booriae TaxID=1552123 RepID=A0A842ET26_9LIST|nr:hypothetical protein [Listeria booriae]MBC2242250.1 hypothetical protein [Listeria booriae]
MAENERQEKLERALIAYFKTDPDMTDDTLLSISRIARNKAILLNIPEYKPLDIVDKKEIATEFKEERYRTTRTVLQDESTEYSAR